MDHDTWQAWYTADYFGLNGKDKSKTIYSFMYAQDSKDIDELRMKALSDVKGKIDNYIKNNKE